jgi:hypothetical protein
MESTDRLAVAAVRQPNGACASAVPVVSTVSGDDQESRHRSIMWSASKPTFRLCRTRPGTGVGKLCADEVDRCGRDPPPQPRVSLAAAPITHSGADATVQPRMTPPRRHPTRASSYNRSTEAHDWKRRSERLVRASGHPYTIVRPGWFDYNQSDELRLLLLQGDTRQAGDPATVRWRGVRSLRSWYEASAQTQQCARRLSLSQGMARRRRTSTPVCTLEADSAGSLDGAHDVENMPLGDEPQQVQNDLGEL